MTLVRFAGARMAVGSDHLARCGKARMRRGSRCASPKGLTERRRRNSLRPLQRQQARLNLFVDS